MLLKLPILPCAMECTSAQPGMHKACTLPQRSANRVNAESGKLFHRVYTFITLSLLLTQYCNYSFHVP